MHVTFLFEDLFGAVWMFILRFKSNIKVGLKGTFCGNGDEYEGLEDTKFLSRQSSVQAALCHSFN
jgi:hypothetical protein